MITADLALVVHILVAFGPSFVLGLRTRDIFTLWGASWFDGPAPTKEELRLYNWVHLPLCGCAAMWAALMAVVLFHGQSVPSIYTIIGVSAMLSAAANLVGLLVRSVHDTRRHGRPFRYP